MISFIRKGILIIMGQWQQDQRQAESEGRHFAFAEMRFADVVIGSGFFALVAETPFYLVALAGGTGLAAAFVHRGPVPRDSVLLLLECYSRLFQVPL